MSSIPLLEREARIRDAINEILSTDKPNLTEIARKHVIPHSTLWDRFHGRQSRVMAHESQMLLPLYMENILVDRIKLYVELRFPPYADLILNAAQAMSGVRPADN